MGEIENDFNNNNIGSTNHAVVVNDDAAEDIPSAQKTPNQLIFNSQTLIQLETFNADNNYTQNSDWNHVQQNHYQRNYYNNINNYNQPTDYYGNIRSWNQFNSEISNYQSNYPQIQPYSQIQSLPHIQPYPQIQSIPQVQPKQQLQQTRGRPIGSKNKKSNL